MSSLRIIKFALILMGIAFFHSQVFSEEHRIIELPSREKLPKYEWKEKKKTHFRIYYRNADKKYIGKVADKAEKYYWTLGDKLDLMHTKWEGEIYIYDNKEDYLKYTGQPLWSKGYASLERKIIASYVSAEDFLSSTLPHELGHLVLNEYLQGRQVPLCIHEGVAQYAEETTRRRAFKRIIRTARRKGNFIPLDTLFEISPTTLQQMDNTLVGVFYAEALGVIEYLIEKHGKFDFSSFLRRLKKGKDLKSALWWAFNYNSISELSDEWLH